MTLAPLQSLGDPNTLSLLLVAAGLALSIAEALSPGAHFVVVGVSLLAAGLVGLVLGPIATPVVLALLVFVFGMLALYGYRELDLYGGKGTGQTRDSDSLKGATGRVTERVTPTGGEIRLEDGGFNPYYSARALDGEIPVGAEVIVLDPGGGNVLTVAPLDAVEDEIDRELARGRRAAEGGPETDEERERERA